MNRKEGMNVVLNLKYGNLAITLLAALALACLISFGQTEFAQLTGNVIDPAGAGVPAASVTVKSMDTGSLRTVTANASGSFTVSDLIPGNYLVTASAPGFSRIDKQVTLTVGAKSSVDLPLEVGSASTVVEVKDSAVHVDTTTQTLATVVNESQLRELPTLTRNPYDLVGISGNVSEGDACTGTSVTTGCGAGFAINGLREASTNVLLDGAANNDEFAGKVGQAVPLDSISEFSILTNNFTAEYGRAAAGIVNVATKNGTNDFHGTVYEFNRVSDLASNGFNNNAFDIPKSVFTRNQFGYSAGGPIKRNKLFFFSSTEWLRIRSTAVTEVVVPDQNLISLTAPNTQQFFQTYGKLSSGTRIAQTYSINQVNNATGTSLCGSNTACNALNPDMPILDLVAYSAPGDAGGGFPENGYQTVNRIDYNLTDKTQIYGRYALQSTFDFPGYVSNSPYQGFNTPENDFNNNMLVSVVHVFSANWVSQSKAVFNRLNEVQPFGSYPAVPTLYTSEQGTGAIEGTSLVFPGYSPFTPGGSIPFGGPQNFVEFYEDVTYTHGKHDIRFGGALTYLRDNRTFGAYETAGDYLSTGTNVGEAIGGLLNGQLAELAVAVNPQGKYPGDTVNLPLGPPNFSRSNRYWEPALYVQDAWKLSRRLTLNLGVRWEYYGVQSNKNPDLDSNYYYGGGVDTPEGVATGSVQIAPQSPVGGVWKKDYRDFAPRVGFAWDVFGDGKTSFRGGYGIGYERNFGNVTFNIIQNPPNYATIDVTSNQLPLPISTANYGPFAGSSGTLVLPPAELRNINQNIPTAYAHFWSASLERQITNHIVAGLDYSGSKGVDLYDIADQNYPGYGNVFLNQPCSYAASAAYYAGGSPVGACLNYLNPQYTAINVRGANGFSHYDGLNLRAVVNNFAGLQLNFNYTWSHAIDNLSSTFSTANLGTVGSANNGDFILGYLDAFAPNLSKGNADFDIRQRVVVSAVYQVPGFSKDRTWKGQALGGWSLAPIFTARTGSPYSIVDCTYNIRWCPYAAFNGSVPVNGSGSPAAITSTPNTFNFLQLPVSEIDHWTNPMFYFSDLPPYPSNMTGRNTFMGPGFWNLDVGLYKTFRFAERFSMQLRAEAYNLFNHANLYVEGGAADTLTTTYIPACYGCSGTPSDHRNLQLALKLLF